VESRHNRALLSAAHPRGYLQSFSQTFFTTAFALGATTAGLSLVKGSGMAGPLYGTGAEIADLISPLLAGSVPALTGGFSDVAAFGSSEGVVGVVLDESGHELVDEIIKVLVLLSLRLFRPHGFGEPEGS
jgi:hypothetical protein